MPREYEFFVLTNPTEGREQEFNRWYDEVHVPDVLKVPGFTSAKRFKAAKGQDGGKQPHWSYAAIYKIVTDDLPETLKAMHDRAGTPDMIMSEAIDLDGVYATVYERIDSQ